LEVTPLDDGCTEPLALFFGQSDTDGLAFDLARPLVAGAAGPWATVLDGTVVKCSVEEPRKRQIRVKNFNSFAPLAVFA